MVIVLDFMGMCLMVDFKLLVFLLFLFLSPPPPPPFFFVCFVFLRGGGGGGCFIVKQHNYIKVVICLTFSIRV